MKTYAFYVMARHLVGSLPLVELLVKVAEDGRLPNRTPGYGWLYASPAVFKTGGEAKRAGRCIRLVEHQSSLDLSRVPELLNLLRGKYGESTLPVEVGLAGSQGQDTGMVAVKEEV